MMSVVRTVFPTIPTPSSEIETNGLYQSVFNSKRVILLVENAGHAEQIKQLLPTSSSHALVIVTSRKDLGIDLVICLKFFFISLKIVLFSFNFIATCQVLCLYLSPLRPDDSVKLLRVWLSLFKKDKILCY